MLFFFCSKIFFHSPFLDIKKVVLQNTTKNFKNIQKKLLTNTKIRAIINRGLSYKLLIHYKIPQKRSVAML